MPLTSNVTAGIAPIDMGNGPGRVEITHYPAIEATAGLRHLPSKEYMRHLPGSAATTS